jgi:hypothetical protein
LDVARRTLAERGQEPAPSSPADAERELRDLLVLFLLLAGVPERELRFAYKTEPDGSRIEGLARLLGRLLLGGG